MNARRGVLLTAVAIVVLGVALFAYAAGQTDGQAADRLQSALDRSASLPARLELRAVSEMEGSAAFGGGYSQTVHGIGELVPPNGLHLMVDGAGDVAELVILGDRMWVDAGSGLRLSSKVPLGPLTEPRAPLDFVRGPGVAGFAGLGLSRGVLTYRVRMDLDGFELQARIRGDQPVDPDTTGTIEVEIGLLDGLIHRQTLEVTEPADPFSGTGIEHVTTTYSIEYWDHGRPLEVAEPK